MLEEFHELLRRVRHRIDSVGYGIVENLACCAFRSRLLECDVGTVAEFVANVVMRSNVFHGFAAEDAHSPFVVHSATQQMAGRQIAGGVGSRERGIPWW
jgi:hypothetical protein